MTPIPIAKLAWIAGVLDMKGRILKKNNKLRRTPQIVMMVETKDFAVVRELSRYTGTSPEMMNDRPTPEWMRRGCMEHCPKPHIHVEANCGYAPRSLPPVGRWTCTGAGVAIILHNVLPYMINDDGWTEVKDLIIDHTVLHGQGATAIIKQIVRLHNFGWTMPPKFLPTAKSAEILAEVELIEGAVSVS